MSTHEPATYRQAEHPQTEVPIVVNTVTDEYAFLDDPGENTSKGLSSHFRQTPWYEDGSVVEGDGHRPTYVQEHPSDYSNKDIDVLTDEYEELWSGNLKSVELVADAEDTEEALRFYAGHEVGSTHENTMQLFREDLSRDTFDRINPEGGYGRFQVKDVQHLGGTVFLATQRDGNTHRDETYLVDGAAESMIDLGQLDSLPEALDGE